MISDKQLVIEWDKRFCLGIDEIDEQHRIWISLMARLLAATKEPDAEIRKKVVNDVVAELEAYTFYHLKFEEALLEQYHYPELKQHQGEHEQLCKTVEYYKNKLKSSDAPMAARILGDMWNWLMHHILEHDREFVAFITAKNALQLICK